MDNQEEEPQQQRPVLPAQELSEDDDLCSYIFIDQLGVIPGSRLGVYPQQLDFAGPSFEPQTVLSILQETLFRGYSDDSGVRLNDAVNRFSELPIIKIHLESRSTPSARDRFKEHLKRYLITLQPRSKIEIHTTDQYAGFSDRTQLAVFATRHIPSGTTLLELQGRRVALPVEWISDDDGAKARRRNDFSLIRSGRKGKNGDQLFLGTARFVNHDCTPNVRLEARDKYVTYQSIREIKVGEEILAFYGDGYFGPDNCDCLCLTCKSNGAGGFAKISAKLPNGELPHDPPSPAGPSRLSTAASIDVQTPDDINPLALPITVIGAEDGAAPSEHTHDEEEEDSDAESEDFAPRRSKRESALGWKPGHFALRKKQKRKVIEGHVQDGDEDDEPPDDTTRCVTCMRMLGETPITFEDRTFDHHCSRCVRHALIFNLPWPHRRRDEVQDWPPIHLLPDPNGRLPRKISSVPLPSLGLHPEPPILPEALLPIAKERFTFPLRRSILHREKYTMDEYIVDQLRLAAATEVEHEEQLAQAREEAKKNKQAARRAREEKKEKMTAGKIKGSGVWSYYEIMTDEEIQRREEEKNRLTSGTRRGGRFKAGDGEEPELIRRAQIRAREKNEAKQKRDEREAGRKIERKARRGSVSGSDSAPASDPVDASSPSTSNVEDHPSPAPGASSDSPDTSLMDDETDDDEEIQFINIRQAQEIQYLRTKFVKPTMNGSPLAAKDEPSPTKPHSPLPPSPPKASSRTARGVPSVEAGPSTKRLSLPSSSRMRPPSPIVSPAKPGRPTTSSPAHASSAESSGPGPSLVPRKRGRPPGTGKWQKMRAEAEALQKGSGGSSTPSESPGNTTTDKQAEDPRKDKASSSSTRRAGDTVPITLPTTIPKVSDGIIGRLPRLPSMASPILGQTAPVPALRQTSHRTVSNTTTNSSSSTPARPSSDADFLGELLQSARSSMLPRDPLPTTVTRAVPRRPSSGTIVTSTKSTPTGPRQSVLPASASASTPKSFSTAQTPIVPSSAPVIIRPGSSTASTSTNAMRKPAQAPWPASHPGTNQSRATVLGLDQSQAGSVVVALTKGTLKGASSTVDPARAAAVPKKRPFTSVLVDEDIFVDEPKTASSGKTADASAKTPQPGGMSSTDSSKLSNGTIMTFHGSSSSTGQLAEYARRVSTSPSDAANILLAHQQSEIRKKRMIEVTHESRAGRSGRPTTPQSGNTSSTPAADAFSLGPRVRLSNGQFGSARSSPFDTAPSPETGTTEKPRSNDVDPPSPPFTSFHPRHPIGIQAKSHGKPRTSISSSTTAVEESSKPTDSWRPHGSNPTLANGSSTKSDIFAPVSPAVSQNGSTPTSVPASRPVARISSVDIPQKPISPSRFYGGKIIATVSAPSKEPERPIHQCLRRVDHYQPGGANEVGASGSSERGSRAFPGSTSSPPSTASDRVSTHTSITSRPHPASPSDTPDSDSLDDLEVDSHLDSAASSDSYAGTRRTSPLKRRSLESTGQSTVSTVYSPGRSPIHDVDVPGSGSPLFTPPSSPPKAGAAPFPIAPSTAFPSVPKPQDSWKASESPLRSPTVTVSSKRSDPPKPLSSSYSGPHMSAGAYGGAMIRPTAQPGNGASDLEEYPRKTWNRVDLFRYPPRSTDSYTPPVVGSSSTLVSRGGAKSDGPARNPVRETILRYNPYHRLPPRPEVHAGLSSDRPGVNRQNRDTTYPNPRLDLARMDLASSGSKFSLADWSSRSS